MKVIVTRRLPGTVEARLAERFDAELNSSDAPFDRERLSDAMARCDALAPAVTDRIDAPLIERTCGRLKLIANFGAGTDNIASKRRGCGGSRSPTRRAC